MSIVFTEEQRQEISDRLAQGPLADIGFSDVYRKVADWLEHVPDATGVRAWFRGPPRPTVA